MSIQRCDRADDVARLEWMDEAEARSFSAHLDGCEDCRRAQSTLERSTSLLRGLSREFTPEMRVQMRAAVDEKIEAERRPRNIWLPISITASAAVLAVALAVKLSERAEEKPTAVAVVPEKTTPVSPAKVSREPATLRAGSRLPISGGTLTVETDSTLALALDGTADGVRLTEGTIAIDISSESIFIVDTPKAEIRAAGGSVRVIAGREDVAVEVLRGAADVQARGDALLPVQHISAGDSVRVPPRLAMVEPKILPKPVQSRSRSRKLVASTPVPQKIVQEEAPIIEAVTPEIPREAEPEPAEVVVLAPAVVEEDPADLIARADRARRSGDLQNAAALYRKVSEMPGALAEEAGYFHADTLAKLGETEAALNALRSSKRKNARLLPERTALQVRLLLAQDRVKDAAIAIEDAGQTIELQSARLAVGKAALENHPALASEVIEPLLSESAPKNIRGQAMRIALLAAHALGDKAKESALRAELDLPSK